MNDSIDKVNVTLWNYMLRINENIGYYCIVYFKLFHLSNVINR